VRAASSSVGPRAQICLMGSIVLSNSIALSSSFLWIAENVHIAVPQLKWSPQRGCQAWAQATTGSLHSRPSPSFYRSPSTHPRPPHFCPVRGKRTVARLLRSDHFTACTPAFTLHLPRRSSTSLTRSQHPRSSGLLCDRSIHGVHALKAF